MYPKAARFISVSVASEDKERRSDEQARRSTPLGLISTWRLMSLPLAALTHLLRVLLQTTTTAVSTRQQQHYSTLLLNVYCTHYLIERSKYFEHYLFLFVPESILLLFINIYKPYNNLTNL